MVFVTNTYGFDDQNHRYYYMPANDDTIFSMTLRYNV